MEGSALSPQGRVNRSARYYDCAMTSGRRGRPPHDDVLTRTEWRVVHAVQHGMTNREIAEHRGISVDAVKFHVANAVAKLGVGSRKALRQWFRAPKESALNRREKTVNTPLKLGPIGQISRSVKDLERAQAWYGDVLGLPHLYTFGNLAFFDCSGTRLLLTQEAQVSAAESILYMLVADIEKAHADLTLRGVEFVNAPHLIHRHANGTEEWMAFFKDPEGRPLAIMSQVKP
jgi:DNA-binding CsgD family transcriptional regulator/catechol 2,3-dioxygenase-like lactoylglutathione lyase family enzyme